jgi:hypothetical protein
MAQSLRSTLAILLQIPQTFHANFQAAFMKLTAVKAVELVAS